MIAIDLTGHTALVGGGSKGLGFASAYKIAQAGGEVILVSRNEENLRNAIEKLPKSEGQSHSYLLADYSKPRMLGEKLDSVDRIDEVDILVNNTGGPPPGMLLDSTLAELLEAVETLLFSSHVATQRVIPNMKRKGYGRIINVTSLSVKEPVRNLGLSNSIRAAVSNWAKTLAMEINEPNITINNVLPGYTLTERLESLFENQAKQSNLTRSEIAKSIETQIPLGRLGEPEEFANAVVFLASPLSSYINGVNLPVDGGFIKSL